MKKTFVFIFLTLFTILGFLYINSRPPIEEGAPPYVAEDLEPPSDPYAWIKDWKRPEGPAKVGLQVGHWKNNELPDELERLRGNTGASGGGKAEWEVNLAIAHKTKELLEVNGITVDILPSTVPKQYWADVFVAIHADGSTDRTASGFKIATPRRDFSQTADILLQAVQTSYSQATGFTQDPNVSRNMTGYYAFAWWRYTHSVHPRTPSIIVETGFLTNASDRKIIVTRPEVSAKGIANGITKYLQIQKLL